MRRGIQQSNIAAATLWSWSWTLKGFSYDTDNNTTRSTTRFAHPAFTSRFSYDTEQTQLALRLASLIALLNRTTQLTLRLASLITGSS